MSMAAIRKEENNEEKIFNFQQAIKKYEKKLSELLKQDQKESKIIQELSVVKRELTQAEKELIFYREKEINLEKADERRNSTIPILKKRIEELEEEANQNVLRKYFINHEDIAWTIARRYNLPVGKILASEQKKLFFLSAILQQRVKGQEEALRGISDAIFRSRVGIQDPSRPLASFLFVGPTGVGKTLVSLTIAEQLFDQKQNLVRLDMTEFSEPHSVSKLIGAPPGYIGFENKPILEVVREKMNSVILFDEIEKCHPEVINLLLQILDNGFISLADGREVNFRNTIIILTTNLGSELYFEERDKNELQEGLNYELKKHFRPEFLNRLDEIVFFSPLSEEIVSEIVVKELEIFIQRVEQEKGVKLQYNEKIIEKVFREAYFPEYGARPIKHYIEKQIGTLVARGIVSQFIHFSGNYLLDLEKETNEIKITKLASLETKKNLLKEKHE
ncbi:6818_t:CDS:1 [Funneliformis geosporum]|uniref:6818_t:CDS:1 n=1 Tax=Funneliformis geosporum TaxID=1117311 RepID=A0A9W4WHS0_9GLOM|nr:6818_t:CDS:1 [Funneliformis geosporum]